MTRSILLLYVVTFLILGTSLTSAGSTTLTTYYPAPTGNYDKLTAKNIGINDTATAAQQRLSIANGEIGIGQQNDSTTYMRLGMDTGWVQYMANNAYWTGSQYNHVNAAGYGGLSSRIYQVSGTIGFDTGISGAEPISWQNRMYIANNGNVGIGTSGPVTSLNLVGTSGSTELHIHDGKGSGGAGGSLAKVGFSIVDGAHNMGNGGETAQIVAGANAGTYGYLDFFAYNQGPAIMRILGTGNVGIGTTTPNRKLEVYSGNGDTIDFGQDADNSQSIQTSIDGQWASRTTYAGGCCNTLKIQPDVGNIILGSASNTQGTTLYGNLTMPANGSIILLPEVSGNSGYTGLMANNGFFGDGVPWYGGVGREPGGWAYPYPDLVISNHTGIRLDAHSNYGGIRFYEQLGPCNVWNAWSSTGCEIARFRGDPWGGSYFMTNVGIGTASPAAKLHISSGDAVALQLGPNSTWGATLRLGGWFGDTSTSGIRVSNGNLHMDSQGGYGMYLNYFSNGWLDIGNGGGSTTVHNNLSVTGGIYGNNAYIQGLAGRNEFRDAEGAGWLRVGAAWGVPGIYSENTSIVVGAANSVIWLNGNVTASSYACQSDQRLKKNIHPITNALDKVQRLDGVTFNWKKSGDKSMGLIAQNVEKVVPELVGVGPDGMKSIQYGNMVGLLIEAMKEQQKKIEKLEKQVAVLQKTIRN